MSSTMTNKSMCKSNEEVEIRRGPWTLEEDNLLIHYITCHGEGRWNLLAKCAGLKRTGKSCRLRWLNYLKPDIKRGNISPHEQLLILELHSKWGNRWSKIAQHLPGRTDNEIKNYWRTRVQKQARQLNIDSNSKKFLEMIRCFWKPRLLEKMEQTLSSSSSTTTTTTTTTTSTSTMETENSAVPPKPTNEVPLPLSSTHSSKVVEDFNDVNEKSSPMTCSSICISDAQQVSEHLEVSDHSPCAGNPLENSTAYNNSLVDDCYHVDTSGYSWENFNQAAISTVGCQDIPSLMADNYWFTDDIAGSVWNMDEFWQFREPEKVSI